MKRSEMPPKVEKALAAYKTTRKKYGMCALWTCLRVASEGSWCQKHAAYYRARYVSQRQGDPK